MYLRFTLVELDKDSKRKRGILVAAHDLRNEGDLSPEEFIVVAECLKWFNSKLKVPKELREPGTDRALSWFKASAVEPIGKMWDLVYLMRNHGVNIELFKSENPGRVIYEDEWQVVAFPPRGEKVPW